MGQIWEFLRAISVHFGTETDLKNFQICPILGQSVPIWMPNLTPLVRLPQHCEPTGSHGQVFSRTMEKMKETLCQSCTRKCCKSYLSRLFPCARMLNGYSALYDLPCDIIAGLTVGIMHIPQGMTLFIHGRDHAHTSRYDVIYS